jgi:hypothetical protein
MRPWLLVDVDDVLLWQKREGAGKDDPPHCRHPHHRHLRKQMFGVSARHVDRTMGVKLMRVAEETGAELGWCTGWTDGANIYVSPVFGLPQLPVVRIMDYPAEMKDRPPEGVWKCLNLITWLASPGGQHVRTEQMRPFCWLDNDPDIPGYLAQAHGLPEFRVVTVDPETALTDANLAEARGWLRSLGGA